MSPNTRRLFPNFTSTGDLRSAIIFPFSSSYLPPVRKTYNGPEKRQFFPFFTELHFPR
jgi:hypothetical protein